MSEKTETYHAQIIKRYHRALNWLSIYAFILVVYGGALVTDYILFGLIAFLLSNDILRYPMVALWFDYARTGLALMLIVSAVFHGVLSTYSQIKLDLSLTKEGEPKAATVK